MVAGLPGGHPYATRPTGRRQEPRHVHVHRHLLAASCSGPTILSAPAVVAQQERYVKYDELQALLGISERTIARWVKEGMPSETWGLGNTRRFRASEVLAWARDREYSRTTNPSSPRLLTTSECDRPSEE